MRLRLIRSHIYTLVLMMLLSCRCFAVELSDVAVELKLYCYRISAVRGTEILIFKHPGRDGLWDCCSDFLKPNETFKDGGKRILFSFAGIHANQWVVSKSYDSSVSERRTVPGLVLLCKAYVEDFVHLKHDKFVDYMWANLNDLAPLSFVSDSLKNELTQVLIVHAISW